MSLPQDAIASWPAGIQAWFQHNTFSAADFDVSDLASRKTAADLSVSVVLPARNEGETIAAVVGACTELVGTLVDEVVVIDGDSTDGTVPLAAQAGAVVYDRHSLVPEAGPAVGKGDALWRSLTVTKGDLVVFCDTDVRNPSPEFVIGLLGPLLMAPHVGLVKAFYDRPVHDGENVQANAGGRVTELLARPLINLFWPELAGLIQPLSGEYAGRRELLEQLPFFTGYGVEIGLLIDTLRLRGADAIAQVDLTERVHRNQDMHALSRMAYGILHVGAHRLAEEGRLVPGDIGLLSPYVQFERTEAGMRPVLDDISAIERPPIRSLQR